VGQKAVLDGTTNRKLPTLLSGIEVVPLNRELSRRHAMVIEVLQQTNNVSSNDN
jgi:hypothetical protein